MIHICGAIEISYIIITGAAANRYITVDIVVNRIIAGTGVDRHVAVIVVDVIVAGSTGDFHSVVVIDVSILFIDICICMTDLS